MRRNIIPLTQFQAEDAAITAEMEYLKAKEEMASALDMRNYYRDYDVQNHKNEEAIAKAKMDAIVFQANRFTQKPDVITKVVAAVTEATIATARRMKREEELNRLEREVADLRKKADELGVEFPAEWFKSA